MIERVVFLTRASPKSVILATPRAVMRTLELCAQTLLANGVTRERHETTSLPFHVTVNDFGCATVQIVEARGNVEHDFENPLKRRRRRITTKIVKEITIEAKLGDKGAGDVVHMVIGDDAYKLHDVFMSEVAEKGQLFDLIVRHDAANVANGNLDFAICASVAVEESQVSNQPSKRHEPSNNIHIFEASRTNFFSLHDGIW